MLNYIPEFHIYLVNWRFLLSKKVKKISRGFYVTYLKRKYRIVLNGFLQKLSEIPNVTYSVTYVT